MKRQLILPCIGLMALLAVAIAPSVYAGIGISSPNDLRGEEGEVIHFKVAVYNWEDISVKVIVNASGDIENYITFENNNLILNPSEIRKINCYFTSPIGIFEGEIGVSGKPAGGGVKLIGGAAIRVKITITEEVVEENIPEDIPDEDTPPVDDVPPVVPPADDTENDDIPEPENEFVPIEEPENEPETPIENLIIPPEDDGEAETPPEDTSQDIPEDENELDIPDLPKVSIKSDNTPLMVFVSLTTIGIAAIGMLYFKGYFKDKKKVKSDEQ